MIVARGYQGPFRLWIGEPGCDRLEVVNYPLETMMRHWIRDVRELLRQMDADPVFSAPGKVALATTLCAAPSDWRHGIRIQP